MIRCTTQRQASLPQAPEGLETARDTLLGKHLRRKIGDHYLNSRNHEHRKEQTLGDNGSKQETAEEQQSERDKELERLIQKVKRNHPNASEDTIRRMLIESGA